MPNIASVLNTFKPCRFGFLIGGLYLLVAVPCSFMHWYEYSISAMTVYYASLPAVIVFRCLEFFGVQVSFESWLFRVVLVTFQTIIYFLLAEGVSFLIRKTIVKNVSVE